MEDQQFARAEAIKREIEVLEKQHIPMYKNALEELSKDPDSIGIYLGHRNNPGYYSRALYSHGEYVDQNRLLLPMSVKDLVEFALLKSEKRIAELELEYKQL